MYVTLTASSSSRRTLGMRRRISSRTDFWRSSSCGRLRKKLVSLTVRFSSRRASAARPSLLGDRPPAGGACRCGHDRRAADLRSREAGRTLGARYCNNCRLGSAEGFGLEVENKLEKAEPRSTISMTRGVRSRECRLGRLVEDLQRGRSWQAKTTHQQKRGSQSSRFKD